MNGEFNFHKKIEFDVLRKTEKALLIKVNRIESDSAMISLSDSLLSYQGEPFPAGQLIYSPRDQQRFIYSVNDTIRPPLYLLQDPSEDYNDEIGSLSRTTMRNAPSWN